MERDDRPTHVEVELTSTGSSAPARRLGRRRADSGDRGEPPDTVEPGSDIGEGAEGVAVTGVVAGAGEPDWARRSVAIGAAGLVIGLAGGWLLAGGTGDDDSGAAADPAPTASSSPATTVVDDALEPIDTVRPTTTTRPPRTTTTTAAAVRVVASVDLHPSVPAGDYQVVGLVDNREIATIDVSAGEIEMRDSGSGFIDAFAFEVGPDWVLVGQQDLGRPRVLYDDGEVASPNVGEIWSLLRVPGADLFWRGSNRSPESGVFASFEQVDVEGVETGPVISMEGNWPYGVDPLGGLLTIVQGKTYGITEDGVRQIADGEAIGVSTAVVVSRACDEVLVCDLLITDRATGGVRTVELDRDVLASSAFLFRGPDRPEVSPTGTHVGLALSSGGALELMIIDLETGSVTTLTERTSTWGLAWSPNGDAAFFVEDGTPMVYVVETGTIEPLAEGLGRWSRVEVRS